MFRSPLTLIQNDYQQGKIYADIGKEESLFVTGRNANWRSYDGNQYDFKTIENTAII